MENLLKKQRAKGKENRMKTNKKKSLRLTPEVIIAFILSVSALILSIVSLLVSIN